MEAFQDLCASISRDFRRVWEEGITQLKEQIALVLIKAEEIEGSQAENDKESLKTGKWEDEACEEEGGGGREERGWIKAKRRRRKKGKLLMRWKIGGWSKQRKREDIKQRKRGYGREKGRKWNWNNIGLKSRDQTGGEREERIGTIGTIASRQKHGKRQRKRKQDREYGKLKTFAEENYLCGGRGVLKREGIG